MRKVRGEPIAWTKSRTKNSTSNCCNLEGLAHELGPRGQPKCQPKWLWRRQKTESWGREGGIRQNLSLQGRFVQKVLRKRLAARCISFILNTT